MTGVPIIERAGDLLSRYEVLFCDVWGVVHNGRTAYVDGCRVLADFRSRGGIVVLVTNAPRTARSVAAILAEKHVPREAWDVIVSSGEVSAAHVREEGYASVHHIGPDRDLDLFEAIVAPRVPLHRADALVVTGLVDDHAETGEHYRPRLGEALERRLPLVCANPDLVVDVGGTLLPCAGAIAAVYEEMGGPVFWAGKPHAQAYLMAHRVAEERAARAVAKSKILAIGDAVRTDLAGADAFGIDCLFVGQGIHRDQVMPDGQSHLDRAALDDLMATTTVRPVAAMATLA